MFQVRVAVCGLILSASVGVQSSTAAIVLNAVGVEVLETFDAFRGDGFATSPTSGQLDSSTYRATGFSDGDGAFDANFTTGDFARGTSTGGVSIGGTYAFEVASNDYALGVQADDADFTPGALTIRGVNGTGQTLNFLDVRVDAMWFNDEASSTLWSFRGSFDDVAYDEFFSLQSPGAADLTPAWETIPTGGLIPLGPGLPNGATFFIQIASDDGTLGGRDEFALNNLRITGLTAIPEPGAVCPLLLSCAGLILSRRKRRVSQA